LRSEIDALDIRTAASGTIEPLSRHSERRMALACSSAVRIEM